MEKDMTRCFSEFLAEIEAKDLDADLEGLRTNLVDTPQLIVVKARSGTAACRVVMTPFYPRVSSTVAMSTGRLESAGFEIIGAGVRTAEGMLYTFFSQASSPSIILGATDDPKSMAQRWLTEGSTKIPGLLLHNVGSNLPRDRIEDAMRIWWKGKEVCLVNGMRWMKTKEISKHVSGLRTKVLPVLRTVLRSEFDALEQWVMQERVPAILEKSSLLGACGERSYNYFARNLDTKPELLTKRLAAAKTFRILLPALSDFALDRAGSFPHDIRECVDGGGHLRAMASQHLNISEKEFKSICAAAERDESFMNKGDIFIEEMSRMFHVVPAHRQPLLPNDIRISIGLTPVMTRVRHAFEEVGIDYMKIIDQAAQPGWPRLLANLSGIVKVNHAPHPPDVTVAANVLDSISTLPSSLSEMLFTLVHDPQAEPLKIENRVNTIIGYLLSGKSLIKMAAFADSLDTRRAANVQALLEMEGASSIKWSPLFNSTAFNYKGMSVYELTTPEELAIEAGQMDHCVDTYSSYCLNNGYRILAVKGQGASEYERGTLCIDIRNGVAELRQLKSVHNHSVSPSVAEICSDLVEAINLNLFECDRACALKDAQTYGTNRTFTGVNPEIVKMKLQFAADNLNELLPKDYRQRGVITFIAEKIPAPTTHDVIPCAPVV